MATITSTQNGNWTTGATWVGGVAPTNGDTAIVNHTVTFNEDNASNTYVNITIGHGAELTFLTTADTSLRISGYIRLEGTSGTLTVGDDSTPIEAAFTAEIIADGIDGGPYIQEWGGSASMTFVGSAKTNHTRLNGAITATDTSFDVDAATGWLVGDEIAIENTATYTDASDTEKVTITGVSGTTISYSTGFANNHADNARVINLTRNIIFSSVDATHRWKNMVHISDTSSLVFKNIEIRGNCMATSDYNAVVFLDNSGTQNCIIEGVSQNEVPSSMLNRVGTASDVGATFTECVGYNSYMIYRSFDGCGGSTFIDCVWMNYTKNNGSVYQSDGVNGYATSFHNCVFSNCERPVYFNSGDGGGMAFNNCEFYAMTTSNGIFLSSGVADIIFRNCEFGIGSGAQTNNGSYIQFSVGTHANFINCKLTLAQINFSDRVASSFKPIGFEHYDQTANDHRFKGSNGTIEFDNSATPKEWIIDSTNSTGYIKLIIPVYIESSKTAITLYGTKASTSGWTLEPRMDVYNEDGLLEDSVEFNDNDTSRHQKSATISPTRNGLYHVAVVCQNNNSDFTVDTIEVS